jgi:DNA-binding GntR family transcriptional regulator
VGMWDRQTMENYQSLTDIVYNYISDKVTSGKLKPNESINESAICAELNISRTPVREALMKLSNEGFIEYIPRRGFFTQKLSLERVQGIYRIIGNLEALGASLALQHPERLEIDELSRLVDQMDIAIAAHQYADYNRLQFRFHHIILQASGNEDLVRLVNNLKKTFMRQEYQYQSTTYDIHQIVLTMNNEHRQMIGFIQVKDEQSLKTILTERHWNVKYAEYFTYV